MVLKLAFLAVLLGGGPSVSYAKPRKDAGPKVLLGGTYIENQALQDFIAEFQAKPAQALCGRELLSDRVLTRFAGCASTQCEPPACPADACLGPEEAWRQIQPYVLGCEGTAFFLGLQDQLSTFVDQAQYDFEDNKVWGQVKGYKIVYEEKEYLFTWTRNRAGEVLLKAVGEDVSPARLAAAPHKSEDFSCGLNWAGDLNDDGVVDVLFACTYDVYRKLQGLSLSKKGGYQFFRQAETGGSI